MISRYSVKKPYTVMVAVVLVIILGVVSFTKMNTDLLPSMNLPYAIVMTTCQGASPETVETMVTRPIEQSMATVTDIENVSSQSRENMSMVILEFQESTNMDSVSLEIREKLDQISGYWDETVGKPMIMKLNPDMMPIMIAAVEVDDLDAIEVTDYVDRNISSEIESVAGVASVSVTGNVTERIDVLIKDDKIKNINKKVMNALDGEFEDKEKELNDAQKELDEGIEKLEEGKTELENGKTQLESGKNQLVSGIAQGTQQMNEAEQQIADSEAELARQEEELKQKETEVAEGLARISEGKAEIASGKENFAEIRAGITNIQQAIGALDEQEAALNQSIPAVQEGITAIDTQIAEIDATPDMEGYAQLREELVAQKTELETQLATINAGIAEIQTSRETLNQQLAQIPASLNLSTIEETLTYLTEQEAQLDTTLIELETTEQELTSAQTQIAEGKKQLEQAKEQVKAGKSGLSAGKVQLNTQQLTASIEMSVAESKLTIGSLQIDENEAKLKEAEEQLKSGKEQLADAKKQTKEQTNLSNLITKDLVKGILAGENFSMPAGYITEGKEDYLVRVGDKFKDIKNLEELVILDLGIEGLDPICLSDVADVTLENDSDEVYARLNGNPGVMLTIEKQTGYSTGDVTDRVTKRMEEIEANLPEVHFSVLMDQGVYIDLVVDSVMQNMLFGALLAVIILLLFMKSIKPTLVVAFAIPISVVTALVLMYFSGVTLNIISLSGLALGIGMLVDNSIVVIENIDRLRHKGMPAKEAAIEGAKQVAGAIAASTLTTVCVFAPIVFTEGITKQLFVDMGLTIAYSLLASLIVALTVVPAMSAGLLKKSKPKKFVLLEKIQSVYGVLLKGALKVKILVVLAAMGLLAGSAYLAISKGTAFMPEMESTQATMTIIPEEGATFQEMAQCADEAISRIQDIEDIEGIGAMAGGGGMSAMMGSGNSDSVSVYLLLKEDKVLSGKELEKEILDRTADLPCTVEIATQSMDMSALGGSGIQVEIKGKELDELARIAGDIQEILEETKGTKNVSDSLEDTDKEFRIVVDKAKAMEYQLTVAQVYQEIQKIITESTSATTLSGAVKDYSVYVRDESDEEMNREQLEKLVLKVKDQQGEEQKIALSKIADFEEATGPQTITRDAQSRYMTVSAEIADGYNIGLVSTDVESKLADYELPAGYTVQMKGEDETINDAMEQLMLMLVLALIFMYLIMVAQFQSLLSPFIIMFTVPLAFTGGFFALVAADMEVSVIAMIGFVMLSGIIVNNGIVLVDYTNQLREEGLEKKEALIQAGKDRLRPIIMTALTTVLGLSTMAAGLGMGGDMVQPMAVVTIGGLLYGTLLTLFVVPCIYDLLRRK